METEILLGLAYIYYQTLPEKIAVYSRTKPLLKALKLRFKIVKKQDSPDSCCFKSKGYPSRIAFANNKTNIR